MSQILPTKKEFQTKADTVKKELNISRCQAYETLAKQYGYKTYHDIKPILEGNFVPAATVVSKDEFREIEKERIFSQASKVNTYFKFHHKYTNQVFIEDIAYNPKFPSNFWSNPNEDRNYEELQDWWDKAFIISNGNSTFIVYRLDGGAWDRPTRKGTFNKFEEALELAQTLNNIEITSKNKYITLSTGTVVDVSGLFINSKGNRLSADTVSNEFNMLQIEKAKRFIEEFMEKRGTINKSVGTSYSLKHRVEEFLYFYFKGENNYISNGEMIVALDSCGYKIKEIPSSPNIYTNCKTLKDFKKI